MATPTDKTEKISLIGPSTTIKGKIKTTKDLRIDGVLEGNVITKAKVIVGTAGKIKGEIAASDASISGLVEGGIVTDKTLELKQTSTIVGDVSTKELIVENGAKLNGKIKVGLASTSNSNIREIKS